MNSGKTNATRLSSVANSKLKLLLIGLILALVSGMAIQRAFVPRASAALPANFKVIGYMPSWAGDVNSVQYSKLTHINYAFLSPTTDGTGNLQPIYNPNNKLQALVSLAHQNNVKVMISIGGWSGDAVDEKFEDFARNAGSRTNFVNNVVNFVNQYNLDGADIDWEYPTMASASNYTALMSELANAMHSRGKLLTAAVVAEGSTADSIQPAVFNYVDFLNIMSYDGGSPHANYDYSVSNVNFWQNKGLPANKTVLGVPFYARPGESFTYAQAVAANRNNAYVDCATVNGVYGCYNGIPTIERKTTLMLQRGTGMMFWELSQDTFDDTSLVSAIYRVASGGSGPTATPTQVLGTNLALNKPATSSSNESASYTPNLAVDGNASTRWSSAFSDPQWLRIDLGNTYNISRVRLSWEAAYSSAYQVQVSNDGTNFSNIYSTTAGNGGLDDLTGLSGSGRYIRVHGSARGTVYGHSLFEVEVYGSLGTGPTATRTRTRTNTVGGATATRTRTNTVGGATATRTRTNTVGGTTATRTRTNTVGGPTTTRTNTTGTGYPAWAPNTFYAVGATVSYNGANYRCQQAHTSQVGWEPANVPALWVRL